MRRDLVLQLIAVAAMSACGGTSGDGTRQHAMSSGDAGRNGEAGGPSGGAPGAGVGGAGGGGSTAGAGAAGTLPGCIGTDATNEVITLATGQPGASFLVANSASVYWTNTGITAGSGAVMMTSRSPGGEPKTLSGHSDGPAEIALDEQHVYWVVAGQCAPGAGSIWRTAADGSGAPEMVVGNLTCPTGLVVDDASIFWAEGPAGNCAQTVKRAAKTAGAAPTDLGTPETCIAGLGSDDSRIFFAGVTKGGSIHAVPKSGGATVDLGSSLPMAKPRSLAVFGGAVLWTAWRPPSDGFVLSRGVDATMDVVTLLEGLTAPRGIVAASTAVYWVDEPGTNGDGRIMEMCWDSAFTAHDVVPKALAVGALFVDEQGLLWTANEGGTDSLGTINMIVRSPLRQHAASSGPFAQPRGGPTPTSRDPPLERHGNAGTQRALRRGELL